MVEFTISSLIDYSLISALAVFIFLPASGLLLFLSKVAAKKQYTLVKSKSLEKLALLCISFGSLSLALFLLSLLWAGSWWFWEAYVGQLTPGKLALISVVIGPIPLLIALLGAGIAKMIGGTLDAAKVENCIVFGVDIGNVLYTMFMMHWLMIFTGGFAVLGLMASGIWALVNWVQ